MYFSAWNESSALVIFWITGTYQAILQLDTPTPVAWRRGTPGPFWGRGRYLWFQVPSDGVFPLPDSDPYTDSDGIGFNSNVQNCFHWTYSDSYACSDSDANGYCTHFGTNISTDKV